MTGERTTRGGEGGAMPSSPARLGARRSGIAGALVAALVAVGGALVGGAPGVDADVAPTAIPGAATAFLVVATAPASGAVAPATAVPVAPTIPPATVLPTPAVPVATSLAPTPVASATAATPLAGGATVAGTPGPPPHPGSATPTVTAASVTSTATVAVTATSTTTVVATATSTTTVVATATSTTTVVATATARAKAINAGVTARASLGARAFTSAPSVDLVLVGAPSLALGPGQVIAVDMQAWAGTTGVVGIDAFLNFDPAKLRVESIDMAGNPLDSFQYRTWDNAAGHVNVTAGRITGASGTGATGYFRVARLTFRPAPGFTASSADVAFAFKRDENRETAVLSRDRSVLNAATGATIALHPAGGIATATFSTGIASIVAGVPSSISFTILDAANLPAAGVAYALEAHGDISRVGPAAGTTGTDGVAVARVTGTTSGATSGATGVVSVKVDGTLRQARIVQVATPVTVKVAIASPSFVLANGTIPVVATTTFGPVPHDSRFEVEWRYRVEADALPKPIQPAAVVLVSGGVATATWDATTLDLAPAGVTRAGVFLDAEARAVDATGNVVGLATATFGPMTIDNQAPALAAVAVAGQPMADDPAVRTRVATRTFAIAGVTEDASTVAVYRRDALEGPRPASALPLATAVAGQVTVQRASVKPRAVVSPATASFMVNLPRFDDDVKDEAAAGFYIEVEATDPAGNVGPVNGRPVATADPYQGWVTIDTVAPRVVKIATPTFAPGIDVDAGSRPITIEFSEPVALAPADYGKRVRLEQEILNIPQPIAATLEVDCAKDVRPGGEFTVAPGAGGTCAAGVRVARIVPAVPWYPGSTYHVTVASADDTAPVVADLAGNSLVANDADGVATNRRTFIAPGAPAYPVVGVTGILADAVIHSTAVVRQPLAATTANVDTALTWRLCANEACSGDGGALAPIGSASPTFTVATTTFDVVQWNTMAEDGSGTRTFPDRADAWVVVDGFNSRLSGQAGYARDFRHVTLRSVAPVVTAASIRAVPCVGGVPVGEEQVASATFNLADDCAPEVTGFQTALTGVVPDSVGGTVTVDAQVAGGAPVNLVTAKPYGRTVDGTDPAWTTLVGTAPDGWVTIPNGREVTVGVTATDRAVPVPNVTPRVTATARVDTVPPVVSIAYPANASRLSSASATFDVPAVGASEPGSIVDLRLLQVKPDPGTVYETTLPATSTFRFRYPETGGTPLGPGTYQLTASATDDAGNPGPVATSTFQVTPPPPAAILDVPGGDGKVGRGDDDDADTDGVQVVLRGRLPEGTTAAQVPEGLVARLIRNGKDALGDGNRPVVAPVTLATGTYGFAFPALTFRADDTSAYAVVTSDDAGNRSAASSPTSSLVVDLTAPTFSVATPRDGATVGTYTPELAMVIAPSAGGTYDTTRVTFEVRKAASETFRIVGDIPVDPAALATASGGAGLVSFSSWGTDGLDPVAGDGEDYVLRVTATDEVGNARAASSTFILKPGVPSVTITQGEPAVPVLGTFDVTGDASPVIGATAGVTGDGVTLRSVTATIRNRAGAAFPATVPMTGTGATRTFDFTGIALPNGSIHDLVVTATDSNDRTATAAATVRVVRPRDLKVRVTKGLATVAGATVRALRDGGALPAVSAAATTTGDGVADFAGITGGPVLVAVTGVPGYADTTVAATVTEPHAAATWTFAIDLDALNPNRVVTTLRGLPESVRTSGSPSDLVAVDVVAPAGTRFGDTVIGVAPSPLVHTFANVISKVDRQVTRAVPVATGTVATGTMVTTTRLPEGAIAWRVIPTLSGSAAADAKLKGASEASAAFGAATGEDVAVSFRYGATNLRVKSLSGTVTRPDGGPVPGATVVIAQVGGLSVKEVTSVEGTFGPVLLEAGDAGVYTVTAVSSPGADWLPGRAGRVAFATGDDASVPESGTVDLRVLAAGGTVQARLTRAGTGGTATLATGKVILNGQGQVITATAGAAVLPGQDALTGPNVTVAAPSGIYVLTVVPDDASLTPPDPLAIRVIDGKVRLLDATDLPPMEKTLGRLTGLVRLTTGEPLAGLVVQARRDGEASVIPATTDDAGTYSVAAPEGSYVVSAVIPRGAALLPGNAMAAVVAKRTTTTVNDLVIAPAAAVIERNLVTASGALSDDEAAGLSGTAFVKNLDTGAGTSIAFTGTRVRVSVPEGRYRLGIAITAGAFLAPEAETGTPAGSGIVASAGSPNVANSTLTPSNIKVTGRLECQSCDLPDHLVKKVRTVVRATGTSGAAAGVVNLTESNDAGTFAFTLAPGTWRLAASPDASQGFLTNPDRPYTEVTVAASGAVSPASPGIDLKAASRTVTGKAFVSIGGVPVPLAGVKVRLEVIGATGGALTLSEVTDRDGLFTFAAPTGNATVSVSGASARYGTSKGGKVADDPAYVIDPAPAGVTNDAAADIGFTDASIKVDGTVATGDGRPVGGVTVSATSSDGRVRTTVTSGGKSPGNYEFRLSPGTWDLVAATEITRANGSRVPADAKRTLTNLSSDQAGQTLTLAIAATAVELPPSATAGADAESGGQVRAGKDSAQLALAPNAVSEPVNVTIVPIGSVPSVPGFYPFGDAFRISATTVSSGLPVGSLAVDSTVTITYSRTTLAKSSVAADQFPATASDLRAALFDTTTGYTAFDGAVATVINGETGQFTISTTSLGTFVLTTRTLLTPIPPIVTGVTASASSGTLRAGANVTLTVGFSQPVTVSTSGGVPRIAMGTGANGAARTPATYATYASGSGSTALTFTYVVQVGDTAADLDYAGTGALDANGGTLRNADGVNATLTLATPGQAGSISVGSAIVIDTRPIVTGVTASPSSGTLRAGATVTLTVGFDQAVTVSTSGGTPRIAMGTGANGAARTPATYATYASGSGTTALTFTYVVQVGDTAADLDYAGAAALEANGGTIRNADGVDAVLALATPGQAGSISVGSAIVIDTTPVVVPPVVVPPTGGGGGGEAPVAPAKAPVVEAAVAAPAPPAPVGFPAPIVSGPAGLAIDRLSGAFAAIPGGFTPAAARAIGEALTSVDASLARAFVDAMAGLPVDQAAAVLGVVAAGTAEEGRAAVAVVATLPPGATIAKPGGSLRTPDGTETLTYSLDEAGGGTAGARRVADAEVAGARHAPTTRGPVVFLVRGGQAALVTRPRSGAWPDVRFPLLAGRLAGSGPAVALPPEATAVTFEPAPTGLNVVERGSLGGGNVVPLAGPFALRVEATDAQARVGIAMPSPRVGPGQALAYLHSLRDRAGRFQGYLRAPAAFDAATGTQSWSLDARAATDLLVLPAALQPAYVQNFDASIHVFSGPDEFAIDFGEAGPAFTTFTVVGPQVVDRIYVYSPVSAGYAWIDVAGVGPSGPPPGEAPETPPAFVRNVDAGARLYSSQFGNAADFGPVGEASVTFAVVAGPENGRFHVFDPRTQNYAWIDAIDVGTSGPP